MRTMRTRRMRLAVVLMGAIAIVASGCSSDDPETSGGEGSDETYSTIRVPDDHETIQAAVDAAEPGDLVLISPGVYNEAVEVGTETALQEQLPDEVFARAYGFAFPVSIGGIAVGALVAPALAAAFELAGALALVGGLVCCYALWLFARRHTAPVVAVTTSSPVNAEPV